MDGNRTIHHLNFPQVVLFQDPSSSPSPYRGLDASYVLNGFVSVPVSKADCAGLSVAHPLLFRAGKDMPAQFRSECAEWRMNELGA